MELVLYYIQASKYLIVSFFTIAFILGIAIYIGMKDFRQDKKDKIFFYGIFLKMKNIDILKLSISVIKVFLVVYATTISKEKIMLICIAMIGILVVLNIICSIKRIIYGVVSTIMQVVMIYLLYIINSYSMDIQNTIEILAIRTGIIIFILIMSAYMFFKEIEMISRDSMNREFNKKIKEGKCK